ncbi:DUF6980 family protein [Desulfovibrio psychrotolerans]|uniref:DUF6980 domain-containing protein n=1 Tax=Desulfovibrio psychrotolerans TaxID=415242 RepID=A0A7J0BWE5_9BACT|nr:hypothetical protein [Desulfovibrio psychrotolerans]GFM38039.1 hypothetical protein DSM19430T_27230 [Desulfovibrio psychrotolerans]
MNQHCCEWMDSFLQDDSINIHYDEVLREYYVIIDECAAVQCIFYCPWCGVKLPASLRDVYFGLIWEKYGDDVDVDCELLPIEMRSSAWWKNRKEIITELLEKYHNASEGIKGRCLMLKTMNSAIS